MTNLPPRCSLGDGCRCVSEQTLCLCRWLRVFGHYINDPVFIQSLISGDKKNGTDLHSLNQRALGVSCKSRDDAKTFIYAWLLGAECGKLRAAFQSAKDAGRQEALGIVETYVCSTAHLGGLAEAIRDRIGQP